MLNSFKIKNFFGFTLIEVLISISIITILASIGMIVFNTIQKNNRDQIRLRNLQSVKQALDLYRSDIGDYPTGSSGLIPKYLISWPSDPVNGRLYVYDKTATGFVVCAKKEGNIANFSPCESLDCAGANVKCNIGLQSD